MYSVTAQGLVNVSTSTMHHAVADAFRPFREDDEIVTVR